MLRDLHAQDVVLTDYRQTNASRFPGRQMLLPPIAALQRRGFPSRRQMNAIDHPNSPAARQRNPLHSGFHSRGR